MEGERERRVVVVKEMAVEERMAVVECEVD